MKAAVKPNGAFPTTTGACIDRLWKLDSERDKLKVKLGELDKQYHALEAHLLDTLPAAQLNGAAGAKAKVSITKPDVPSVKDWDKVWVYISRNKAWDLMQKRLSTEACRERWAAHKVIPGVEIFTKVKLNLSARK